MTAIRRKRGQSGRTMTPGARRGGELSPMARGQARAAAIGGAIKQDEVATAAMWAAHYHAGHVPFRRDCAVCLEAAGRDRPRRMVAHPSAFTWSLDLMGPFVESHDQELPYARYGLVTMVTIPTEEELPVVRGLQELGAKAPKSRKRPLPRLEEEHLEVNPELGPWEAPVDQVHEELTEAEITKVQVLAKEWKDFLKEAKDVGEMKTLTFVNPVKSRSAKDVLDGISRVYARIQALQIPILRAHMDREKAFVSKEVTAWMARKGLYCTYTAGDEPCGNARAEREIGVLRGRCRALMKSTRLDPSLWALAFRHAGEERLRAQLWQLGVVTPTLLPFGSQAMVKKKTWFQRGDPWKWPMTAVTILGPAGDMSSTSGGYYCRDEEGRFFRSTVVVIPRQQATTAKALEDELFRLQHQQGMEDREEQKGGDEDLPRFAEDAELQEPRLDEEPPQPRGAAEDIFEAFRLQSTHEGKRISQSAHESKRISQSVHERMETSQERKQDLHDSGNGFGPDSPEEGEDLRNVVLQEREESDVLVVVDPPVRRVHGKATPGQLLPGPTPTTPPFLCHMRKGGEWTQDEDNVEEQYEEEELREKMAIWQHKRIKSMVQEEIAELLEGQAADGWIEKLVEETRAMEEAMEVKARIKALAVPEVLQARTVPLEEVRQDLATWKPAFVKEYETLTSGPVEVLSPKQYQELRDGGQEMEILPMKAVTVRKPDKYKARFVVCGNMAVEPCVEDTSVGGICTVALRCMIHRAAISKWKLASIDVAGAFLQAPRRGEKVTLVEPPAILRQLGLCSCGEKWRVRCALYGFAESQADWGHFRDRTLSTLTWSVEGQKYGVTATGEPHLWKIVNVEQDERPTCGYVAIYVDDVLATGDEAVLTSFFQAVKQLWRCSEEEWVTQKDWTRFCGYELRSDGEKGYYLSQEGYVRDLLSRRKIEGRETVPLPKIVDGEDEVMCGSALKEAQGLVGELQWIASRTRPDVSYSTGVLARMMHRRPKYTVQMAGYLLKYLKVTTGRCLHYKSKTEETEERLVVATDASFAPEHEQLRSVTGVIIRHHHNTLQWVSMRQPFVALSTCEAELLAFAEGFQDGESTSALMELLQFKVKKQLVGDCRAALAQVVGETGPWRTRHLRLRASRLREAVKEEGGSWIASYLAGTELVADGATKPLQGGAFKSFVERLGMTDVQAESDEQEEWSENEEKDPVHVKSLCNRKDLCHEGGTALVGGGLALMCSGQHRRLATLLLTCGLLLKGWEGLQDRKKMTQDRKDDSNKIGKEQDSQKNESRSGTAEGYGETGTTTPKSKKVSCRIEKEKQEPLGLQKMNQKPEGHQDRMTEGQDPWWTRNPGSGIHTPKGLVVRETTPEPSQNGRNQEGEGRPLPGLRAMRKGCSAGSHGMEGQSAHGVSAGAAADGTTYGAAAGAAAMRGRAAMPMLDQRREIEREEGDLRVDVKVTVTTTKGKKETTSYAEMAEVPTPYPMSGGTGMGGRGQASTVRGQGCEVHQQLWSEMETEYVKNQEFPGQESPWQRPIYQKPMTGKSDFWDLSWIEQGWLLRHHPKSRKRYFHPLHSTLPVMGERLGSRRVTVRFFEDGTRVVEEGDWRCSTRSDDNKVWRGCTWFQLITDGSATSSSAAAAGGGMASSSRATNDVATTLAEESDGSYEMCP